MADPGPVADASGQDDEGELFAIDRGEPPQDAAVKNQPNQAATVSSPHAGGRIPKKPKAEESSDEEEGLEPETNIGNGLNFTPASAAPGAAVPQEEDDDDIFVLDDDDDEEEEGGIKSDPIAANVSTSANNSFQQASSQPGGTPASLNAQQATAMLLAGTLTNGPNAGGGGAAHPPPPLPPPVASRPSRPMSNAMPNTGAMFHGSGPLKLPDGVILPPSITPELMSDRLREMLYQLPPDTMKDAFLEYDNAVTVKGHSIRSHQAYLHGVLKRYVQLIGGDVKNLTKDPLPGRSGGGGGVMNNAMGSYGPASAGGPSLGQYGRGGGDPRGAPGMGVGAMSNTHSAIKSDFSQEVKDRLRMMVGRGFCSDEDLRDERVRSKLLALSDKDALNAIDELLGVDSTIIRSFSSYFLGIINRYARGEGRAQREEARHKKSGGAEPSDRRRDDRDRDRRRDRSRSRSPGYHRGRGHSRSRSPDYHRSSRSSRRYRDSSRSRSPDHYRSSRRHSREYDDDDYPRGSRSRRDRDRRSRSRSPSDRDRRRRDRDDRYSSSSSKRPTSSSRSMPDEKTRAAAAQALNNAFNSAFSPGHPQPPQIPAPGMPMGGGYPMAPPQGQMPFPPQQPNYPARPGQQSSWQGGPSAPGAPGQFMTPHQQAAYAAAAARGAPTGGNPAFDILGLAEKAAEAVKFLGGGGGPRMAPGGGMSNGNPYGQGQGHGQPPPPPPRQHGFPQGMQQYMPQQQHQQQAPASGTELPITIQYALQNLMASGHIDGPGIDPGLIRFINLLPEQSCLESLQTLSSIDTSKIRNKNGYLAGILKKQLAAMNISF